MSDSWGRSCEWATSGPTECPLTIDCKCIRYVAAALFGKATVSGIWNLQMYLFGKHMPSFIRNLILSKNENLFSNASALPILNRVGENSNKCISY
jgi:hypothetical protein